MRGAGWKRKKEEIEKLYSQFKQIQAAGSSVVGASASSPGPGDSAGGVSNSGQQEKLEDSVAGDLVGFIGIGNSEQEKQQLDFSQGKVSDGTIIQTGFFGTL